MTKREFMEQLNNIGADETEIFLRGADNFIMPVTNTIIMGDGTGTDEICLISGQKETTVKELIACLSLEKLPSEKGMVRKSDVMAIVGKQKVLLHESDSLFESLKELKEEYHSTGEFVVDGNSYSIGQMMEELRNDTKIGRQFRKNVNKNILTYMMKFGGDEE